MNAVSIAFIVLGVLLVGILGWVIALYNGLITLRNRTDEAWSDIDVQLKRRYDLIPNLINTIKGYAKHEQETFDKVIKARSAAMGAQTVDEHAQAENTLSQSLSRSLPWPKIIRTSRRIRTSCSCRTN